MKCTVFRVNVPFFYTSVPGKADRMPAISIFDIIYSNSLITFYREARREARVHSFIQGSICLQYNSCYIPLEGAAAVGI